MDYLRAFLEGAGRPAKNQNTSLQEPTKPAKPPVNEPKPGFVGSVGFSPGTNPNFKGYSGPSKDVERIHIIMRQCGYPSKSGNTYLQEPTKPTKPPARGLKPGSVGSCPGMKPDFEGHVRPTADPEVAMECTATPAEPLAEPITLVHAVVADWPIAWRERWGRLANELAEQGISPPTDEHRAFTTVAEERQRGVEPPPIHIPPPTEFPVEPAAPVRWRCGNRFCLHKEAGWWQSRWGVVNCLNCVPPAFPGLAVAQGTGADAPLVDPGRSKC